MVLRRQAVRAEVHVACVLGMRKRPPVHEGKGVHDSLCAKMVSFSDHLPLLYLSLEERKLMSG